MLALDAGNGELLWRFSASNSVNAGRPFLRSAPTVAQKFRETRSSVGVTG
jgi:hypothetical protein